MSETEIRNAFALEMVQAQSSCIESLVRFLEQPCGVPNVVMQDRLRGVQANTCNDFFPGVSATYHLGDSARYPMEIAAWIEPAANKPNAMFCLRVRLQTPSPVEKDRSFGYGEWSHQETQELDPLTMHTKRQSIMDAIDLTLSRFRLKLNGVLPLFASVARRDHLLRGELRQAHEWAQKAKEQPQ